MLLAKLPVSAVVVCTATGPLKGRFWVDVSSLAALLVVPLPGM
jgi:hypothetical protein